MKRLLIIGIIAFLCPGPATAQIGPVTGDLRYEHQYQDVLSGSSLLTSVRMAPSISLATRGSYRSENFLLYTLRTSLSANYRTTHAAGASVATSQLFWNMYDVNLFFLQAAPVTFQLASREYTNEIRYDYEGYRSKGGTRDHEDRIGLSLTRVPFLPLVNLEYVRNRSWALVGEPYEQTSYQYIFSAASRNGTDGHASVSGTLSRLQDSFSGLDERFFTVQFDGSRAISEKHHITMGSEYNSFASYSSISGGASYVGALGDAVQVNTNVTAQQAASRAYSAYSGGISQGVQITQDEHFRYGLGAGIASGISTPPLRGGERVRIPNDAWNTDFNVNHQRMIGTITMSNNLNMSYGERRYLGTLAFYRLGFNNFGSMAVGRFAVNGAYNFSYQTNYNGYSWRAVEHYASLRGDGLLTAAIRSRTAADFRLYDYYGSRYLASDQSTLTLSQDFTGIFNHVIPFTLGAGASIHYYYINIEGHSYGYNATFQSPRFFVRDLIASYRFIRNFDPYYVRSFTEHSASLNYRWRLMRFKLELSQRTVYSRQRDVRFMVERSL